MLRFAPENSPHQLISALFQLKIERDEHQYEVFVRQLLPQSEPDQDLIKNIKLFSFPDPASVEPHTFLTFSIGDSVNFRIGFVLYSTAFDALCVLSDFYYPCLFKRMMKLPYLEMAEVAFQLFKTEKRTTVNIKGKEFSLSGALEKQRAMSLLFKTFAPYDISKIVIGMLQARHVFVVASNAATCSQFAAALSLLIEPFRWSMTLIPILPIKIIDMVEIPVPVLVGLTKVEALTDKSVMKHILVNCDVKLVTDTPVFESDPALRVRVVTEQLKFHKMATEALTKWKGCSGFPHQIFGGLVKTFIAQFLQIYTGPCPSMVDLIRALQNTPDYIANSQVIEEVIAFDRLPPERKREFTEWSGLSFAKDMAANFQKVIVLDGNALQSVERSEERQTDVEPKMQTRASAAKLMDLFKDQPQPAEDLLDFGPPVEGQSGNGKQSQPMDFDDMIWEDD